MLLKIQQVSTGEKIVDIWESKYTFMHCFWWMKIKTNISKVSFLYFTFFPQLYRNIFKVFLSYSLILEICLHLYQWFHMIHVILKEEIISDRKRNLFLENVSEKMRETLNTRNFIFNIARNVYNVSKPSVRWIRMCLFFIMRIIGDLK